jgi:acyl transferase domain-containing protein/NADPH:quinone reductase-like Zn-dependent oxidoreductase/short-subunit dehydrogenase/acyl carrier protein
MSTESAPADRRELMKRALARIEELEQRLKATERRTKEPIAIVGMACRFPGGVGSPDEYWRFLCEGGDGIRPFPPERCDSTDGAEALYGGFVENVDQFDAAFFGITPREARSMDPQQRLLLETTWHALEDAGQAPDELQGSRTGVFVGITTNDYGDLLDELAPDLTDVYVATGNALNAAAGRISFVLGLQGPCMALDTACSSSLVAVHLACRSLTAGECELALAGGVNLVLRPDASKLFAQWGMMAPDGRCKTFDAAADGFVRSEGCGIIALRRLSDARARGDRILAVVAGSAVNSDGRSSGLTVPNGLAQQALIRQALEDAGTTAADVHYVEAHGTGTSLGDPIEIEALARALAMGRPTDRPLLVGSVKTNIGHTEAASGIAGLMKTALAISHGRIPAHLHFKDPSPAISWNVAPIRVVTQLTEWPSEPGRKRLAGVSSFGFSGTNAHVILAGAPDALDEDRTIARGRSTHVLTLSARHPEVLRSLGAAYAERLATTHTEAFVNLCRSANVGRARLPERLAVVAESPEQARRALSTWSERGTASSVFRGTAKLSGTPRIAFLFTGQGSQYAGMGKGLFEGSHVFRQTIERCAGLLQPHLDRPLLDVLFGANSEAINDTVYAQPALFALEYALAELWRSWGIVPDLVLGHSIGELVAATVAGVMGLEDALRLVAARGRLMQELPRNGAMATVFADPTVVHSALNGRHENTLAIAAVNGPQNTVISGTKDALERVLTTLGEQGVGHMRLTVSHAFHSPLMDPMLNGFEHEARTIDYRAPSCVVISNVTAKPIGADGFSASYWRSHARSPVQFLGSIHELSANNIDLALELGPAPTLTGLVNRAVGGNGLCAIEGLKRGKDNWASICEAAAKLHVGGARIDWKRFDADTPWKRVSVPTYPFQRARYWVPKQDDRQSGLVTADRRPDDAARPELRLAVTEAKHGYPGSSRSTIAAVTTHPLLGDRLSLSIPGVVFEQRLSTSTANFLKDHRILGQQILSGTSFVEMALAAARHATGASAVALQDLTIERPLVLRNDNGLVQTTIVSNGTGGFEVCTASLDEQSNSGTWVSHARSSVTTTGDAGKEMGTIAARLESVRRQARTIKNGDDYYAALQDLGLDYGPAFRAIRRLWCAEQCAVGELRLDPSAGAAETYSIHPALFDACLHAIGGVMGLHDSQEQHVYVPTTFGRVHWFGITAAAGWCLVEIAPPINPQSVSANIWFMSEDGNVCFAAEGVEVRRVSADALSRATSPSVDRLIHQLSWRVSEEESPTRTPDGPCVLWCDDRDFVAAVRDQLPAVTVINLRTGDRFETAEDEFVVRIGEIDDLQQVWDRLADRRVTPTNLVCVETGRDANGFADTTSETVTGRACARLLGVAKAVDRLCTQGELRVTAVTVGAVQVVAPSERPDLTGAPLWGMCRSLRDEQPSSQWRLVDLDPYAVTGARAEALAHELAASSPEPESAWRNGERYVPRLVRGQLHPEHLQAAGETNRVEVRIAQRGKLEGLELGSKPRCHPGPDEVEIEVRAAGLNFRDVLNLLGMYPGDAGALGAECAGRVVRVGSTVAGLKAGDEVVALANPAIASHVNASAVLTLRKPPQLSYEEAAAVPVAFLTAWFALEYVGRLKAGERVLVHAGAGGVGLAAIQLARRAGAVIYATAGSERKRAFLRQIGVSHVYDSRTLHFARDIRRDTDFQGVDLVLNSLTGEAVSESLALVRPGGRFLEIGKNDVRDSVEIARSYPETAYHVLDLGDLITSNPSLVRSAFEQILEDLASGALTGLPLQVFPLGDPTRAFRFMARARHIGKIVLTPRHVSGGGTVIRPDATYLVTGGFGALGRQVITQLAEDGATHIVALGRRPPAAMAEFLLSFGNHVSVECMTADVTQRAQLASVFDCIDATMPPLAGIVHAAGVVEDGLATTQTWEAFERVLQAKALGAWHLHELTKNRSLDFFVMFSSMSSLFGSAGQSNYAAANAFLDALAGYRQATGLAGTSINWGAWAGEGMAQKVESAQRQRWHDLGVSLIEPREGRAAFSRLVTAGLVQIAVVSVDWARAASHFGDRGPSLLADLMPRQNVDVRHGDWRKLLGEGSIESRHTVLEVLVKEKVGTVLQLPQEQLESQTSLTSMGIDSLMAVELRHEFETALAVKISIADLLGDATIGSLAERFSQMIPIDGIAESEVHAASLTVDEGEI